MLPVVMYAVLLKLVSVLIYAGLVSECQGRVQEKVRSTQYMLDGNKIWLTASDAEEKSPDGRVAEKLTDIYRLAPEKYTHTDGMVPEKFTARLVQEDFTTTPGLVREIVTEKSQPKRHKSKKEIVKQSILMTGKYAKKDRGKYKKLRSKYKKRLRLMEKLYKTKCVDTYSEECVDLLNKITHAQSGVKKRFLLRNFLDKIDFRVCFSGSGLVHYDPETQVCCNGVFNKTSGSEECCNGAIIDSRRQFCCNEHVQNRTDFSECCGTYTYDERTHHCCNGNLFSKLHGSDCCGDSICDAGEEICCYDMYKFNRSEGDECCGTRVYDSTMNVCCGTSIQPIHGKKNKKGECCKNISYHTSCYKCENDVILPVFNETSDVCCEGKITGRKYGNSTGCCLRQVIDTRTQHCVDDEIISSYFISVSDAVVVVVEGTNVTVGYDNGVSVTLESLKPAVRRSHQVPVIVIVSVGCVAVTVVGVLVVTLICSRRLRRKAFSNSTNESQYYLNNDRLSSNDYQHTNTVRYPFPPETITTLLELVENVDLEEKNGVSNIIKSDVNIHEANTLSNHYKNSYTQTSPEKESNRRTIFGKPYDYNYILGLSNGTVKMPNSDAKMTLPQSLLRLNKVEVNCSSFRMISPLRKKLGLGDDEMIASPVVEYALTGYGTLPDYAVVILPFLGSPAELKVRKFKSDEGLDTVVKSFDVPVQGKTNEDVDAFYIVKDSEVYIYTKSFSGFYCTTCRDRPLRLRCFLFGSYKRFTNPLRHEVRIMIYLADDLLKFADYKERMFTNENAEGRVLKKEMQLRLPADLTVNDIIQASITPTESHLSHWIHKLYPGETTPIYDEIQSIMLDNVVEKCKDFEFCRLPEHDIPYCIEWYLTNAPGVIPNYTFQCIIDIDIIRVANTTKTTNRIVIDELQLRQEDRYPIEEQSTARSVQGLKEYLAGSMAPNKRDVVLGTLVSKYRCTGTTVEEVFFKLQEKLTPTYLLEAVAIVMREKQMFDELHLLQVYGFLPQNIVSTNLQPVCEDPGFGAGQVRIENQSMGQNGVENCNAGQAERENHTTAHVTRDNCDAGQTMRGNQTAGPFEDHTLGQNSMEFRPAGKTAPDDQTRLRGNPNCVDMNGGESQGVENLHTCIRQPIVTNINEELVESPKLVNRSADPKNVRPELSRRHLMMPSSGEDLTLTGATSVIGIRGEITTPTVDSKSSPESVKPHTQECASLDETYVKETPKRTESQD